MLRSYIYVQLWVILVHTVGEWLCSYDLSLKARLLYLALTKSVAKVVLNIVWMESGPVDTIA